MFKGIAPPDWFIERNAVFIKRPENDAYGASCLFLWEMVRRIRVISVHILLEITAGIYRARRKTKFNTGPDLPEITEKKQNNRFASKWVTVVQYTYFQVKSNASTQYL